MIHLLLKSNEHEYQYLAYLLYDLLSNDTNGSIDTQEQTLLFDSLPWTIKKYFRDAMKQTIQYTNNLSNFDNETVYWENGYARGLFTYITAYDKLTDTVKNQYTPPTDEERAIAKRYLGTVSIRVADQSIAECKSIKTKS